MKKSLLTLASFALMAGSANAMYLIGAPAGEWNPAVGIEMEEVDGGWQWIGYVGLSDYFAFATQLDKSGDWDNFNANYRLSPEQDGTAAAQGVYMLHSGTPEGAFHGLDTECTYFVSEVEGEYTLTVTVNGEVPPTPEATWGVIGSFNDWADDVPMTKVADGVWSVTMPELDGEFKFRANNSWDVNYGGKEYSFDIYEDGNYQLEANGLNFIIDDATDVTLTLDLNNMVVSVTGYVSVPKMLALRGNFIDWEWEWGYYFMESEEPGVYFLYLDAVDADWEFKIANQDWSEQYTTQNPDMVAGEVYDLTVNDGSSANMGVAQAYTDVLMTLDLNNNTLSFTGNGMSGVSSVETTDSAAEYFNMQGIRVNNPVKGVYIRVVDGKSEKVMIKK